MCVYMGEALCFKKCYLNKMIIIFVNNKVEVLLIQVQLNCLLRTFTKVFSKKTNKQETTPWRCKMLYTLSPILRTVAKVKEKCLGLTVLTKKRISAHKGDISATAGGRVPLQCHLKMTE